MKIGRKKEYVSALCKWADSSFELEQIVKSPHVIDISAEYDEINQTANVNLDWQLSPYSDKEIISAAITELKRKCF